MIDFTGQVAVITGGGRGLCRVGDNEWAMADALAEDLDHLIWLTVRQPSRTLEPSP